MILGSDAGIAEEWKWRVPVWSCAGILCTGETDNAGLAALVCNAVASKREAAGGPAAGTQSASSTVRPGDC